MKFDKETIITLTICTILLFAWGPIVKKIWPPKVVDEKVELTTSDKTDNIAIGDKEVKDSASKISPSKITVKDDIKSVSKKVIITKKAIAETSDYLKSQNLKSVYLENDFIKAEINPNSGNISSIELKEYFLSDKTSFAKLKEPIVLFKNSKYGALLLENLPISELIDIKFSTENDNTPEKNVTLFRKFKTSTGKEFTVTQFWKIKENYTITYNIEIANLANNTLTLKDLKLSAGSLSNINELANDKPPFREEHEISYCDSESKKVMSKVAQDSPGFMSMFFGGGKKSGPKEGFEEIEKVNADWIAVSNKYFTCILVPEAPFQDGIVLRSVLLEKPKDKKGVTKFANAEVDALINIDELPAGTDLKLSFNFFAGPKKIPLLKELDPNATKIMKLYMMGMKFLEPISSIMLATLLLFTSYCGSYGLSIILLTLIVKSLLWPVTHRANVSMRKMQRIQPLIKELKKTHQDNPQKVNTEMMKLYKEHKVNPLGGCLPILLQMPIFFALYAALSGAVEPRHTAFLWINDLTLPDTIATLNLGFANIPINPLMITMTATMVLQQKLTPSAADPAQQKMMMFMPLIMLFMLYSLPSGLTLYWTVSQIISIMQLIVNQKLEKRAELALELQKK